MDQFPHVDQFRVAPDDSTASLVTPDLAPGRFPAVHVFGDCATFCYMTKQSKRVGVRELRQNLSVYLRRIGSGETLEVTEHGSSVAILAPMPSPLKPLERLAAQGKLIPAKLDLLSLGIPAGKISKSASRALAGLRDDRV